MNGSENGGSPRQPIAFISHHSSQAETARRLKVILGHHGIKGWMAPDDINPGQPFDKAIVAQVRQSDLIILLFCEQSDQSRHVKRELMMAEDADKLIFPVRLEDKAADGLAYWLNDYQWIDWFDGEDDTITRMIDTIKSQAETDTAASAATAPAPPPQPQSAAPVAPPAPAGSSGSQWTIPVTTALIVAVVMLAGFYFMMPGGDSNEPAEAANVESAAEPAESATDAPPATTAPPPTPTTPPMPTPITPPPPAGSGDFYVVLGSFPLNDPAATVRADEFAACAGIRPLVGPSDNYAGFTPGLTVVLIGGYTDAREANAALETAQACVVDAYIRAAR